MSADPLGCKRGLGKVVRQGRLSPRFSGAIGEAEQDQGELGRAALRRTFAWWTALPFLIAVPDAAWAQAVEPRRSPRPRRPPSRSIEFSADQVTYDSDADVVTASGEVRMSREGNYLAADQVVWNRKTGEVRANGEVVMITPQGDKLIGENVVLTDTLRDGTDRKSAGRARQRRPDRRAARSPQRATSRPSTMRSIRRAR